MIEVALRSSRTRTTVPSKDQPHDRLLGERAGVPGPQSAFTFRHTRLTVSLPTVPPNSAASARRTRRVYHPSDATVAHLQNTFP